MSRFWGIAHEVVPVLAEHSRQVDAESAFPTESVNALRDAGLFGLLVPKSQGGLGGDIEDLVDVALELGGACLSTATIWAMHCQQVDIILRHASEELRAELLPKIARQGYYLASVTTEAGAGSQLLNVESALADECGQLVVERQAPVVTGGEHADGFVITMRDTSAANVSQVSLVHIHRSQLVSGQVVSEWNAMGMRGSCSIGMHLSGMIGPHQIIGRRGGFRDIAIDSTVPVGYVALSACWLGAARSALDQLASSIRADQRFSDASFGEAKRHRLARARIDIELANTYLHRLRDEIVNRRRSQASMDDLSLKVRLDTLKVVCSELTFSAVDHMVHLAGAALGYKRDSPIPLERHFRDLRSASLNFSNDRLLTVIGSLTLIDGAGRWS